MPAVDEQNLRAPWRERLITENLGLVHAAAHRFSGRGVDYDDLFQAGCIGLVKAADGFEPERGLCFSTYAFPAITGEIKRQFRDGGSVKVGRALKQLSSSAVRQREKFCLRMGREPTVGELAEALGVSPEEAANAVGAAAPVISLTVTDDAEHDSQLDIPVDFGEEGITERMALSQAIRALDPQDTELVKLRFFGGMTQSAAAEKMGMSQVQVSRREKKILAALRQALGDS